MTGRVKLPAGRAPRRDRTIQEYQHDTYKARGKLKEPTVCSQCGAVFHKGRWSWAPKPAGAHETVCPACHRIKDRYPKGLLKLTGRFLADHQEEVLGVVRNEEAKAKAEHPLCRIMNIVREDDVTTVSTTDSHLPRRIGEALHHAYAGEFTFHYDQGGQFIRVFWTR